MGIVNNQGVFIAPPFGEGESRTITSFRDDDDFSTDLFSESVALPNFPDNIGVAFVRSSNSPADYATIALNGTDTSTVYVENTDGAASFAISNDFYVGYKSTILGISSTGISGNSFLNGNLYVSANSFLSGNLYVNGFIYGSFNNTTLQGTTRFGLNTIEISGDDNSISGVGTISASTVSANIGIIPYVGGVSYIIGNSLQISGITSITPSTQLSVNGGLIVSGVSTVGLAATSNLTTNSTLTFELINDTTLAIKVRGTDGVIRSSNIALS
jgi:hypothetical protein